MTRSTNPLVHIVDVVFPNYSPIDGRKSLRQRLVRDASSNVDKPSDHYAAHCKQNGQSGQPGHDVELLLVVQEILIGKQERPETVVRPRPVEYQYARCYRPESQQNERND